MTLNFSFLSILLTSTLTLLSFVMHYSIFLIVWLQTYSSKHLKNQISSRQSQATTSQISQLPDLNDPLCSQSQHILWWTFYFLWPNIIIIQILLFLHPWTSLYPSVYWLQTASTNATSIVHSKLPGSYTSCSHVSALAKGQGTDWVQASRVSITYRVITTSQSTYLFKVSSQYSILVCCHHIQTTYFPRLSKLQTVLFNMQHPTFGINSLTLSWASSTSWSWSFIFSPSSLLRSPKFFIVQRESSGRFSWATRYFLFMESSWHGNLCVQWCFLSWNKENTARCLKVLFSMCYRLWDSRRINCSFFRGTLHSKLALDFLAGLKVYIFGKFLQ